MAIIRERPSVSVGPGGRKQQVGGANRPIVSMAYDKDPLRMVMEPALTAFGTQVGGQLGGTLGAGVGKGLLSGVSSQLVDQSMSPAMRAQQAQGVLESLRTRYGLENQSALTDMQKLKAAGVTDEDQQMISNALRLYQDSLMEAYNRMNQ